MVVRLLLTTFMKSSGPLALVLASTVGTAAAAPRAEFSPTGSVTVGTVRYDSVGAYFADPAIRKTRSCGVAPTPSDRAHRSIGDCTLDRTAIDPAYDPDDDLLVQVIFHVIAKTDGTGKLSPDRISEQLDILNAGYADLHIKFVAARFDPGGAELPVPGYDLVTSDPYFADPGIESPTNPMKTALHWDPARYLNIYTNDGGGNGILGYATFPQEDAGKPLDGIVLAFPTVGKNPAAAPFDLGRTATHEVGHYLGLLHTFQDGCGGADYTTGDLLADTPAQAEPHYGGCDPVPSGCPGGELAAVDNFMNYSDDRCLTTFSDEQVNRARCSLINFRALNTAPAAEFRTTVRGSEVAVESSSTDHESPRTELHHRWDFGDGSQISTEVSPHHRYRTPGHYVIRLEVIDPDSGSAEATFEVDAGAGGADLVGGCSSTGGNGSIALLSLVAAGLVLRRRRGTAARHLRAMLVLVALLSACVVDGGDPGTGGTSTPTAPTTPSDPTDPTDPTNPTPTTFGPNEPQLIDRDGDGRFAVDLEPDGDPDQLYDVDACGEPRIDRDHDSHVDALDLDCNGQIDLLVLADRSVQPAPGANCQAGSPGQGTGHGAGGYACD